MGKKSKKNVEPVKDEFAQMIAEFDVDGDGILTRDELLFALNTYLTEKSVAGDKKALIMEIIQEIVEIIDEDGSNR